MELLINHLSKQYGHSLRSVQALADVSLLVETGVLGLVGPNGAGKSTLMRILATITKPTAGSVTWNGTDIVRSPDALRAQLGYLPQDFGVYPHLTPVEFLEYMAAIKGLTARAAANRIDDLLQILNLIEVRRRPLGTFSGGMRQRVGIAQALLNDPELLVVDEPTAGLDPEERVRFRNLLSDLSGKRIVVLSTHIVSDVEAVATRIAILRHGGLVQCGDPEDLVAGVADKVWEWPIAAGELPSLRDRFLISGTIRYPDRVEARVVADARPAPDARSVAPRLEDAYLYYVNRSDGGGKP